MASPCRIPDHGKEDGRGIDGGVPLLLTTLVACLPLPLPDFRRPATLVTFEGAATPDLTVRVCTWSGQHSVLDGCGDITDGVTAVDGIGVREWSPFPLVLKSETPLWSDLFVACAGDRPRGVTLRLPDLPVKHDMDLVIVLDAPPTRWGANARNDVDDATVAAVSADLCAGRMKSRPE